MNSCRRLKSNKGANDPSVEEMGDDPGFWIQSWDVEFM